MDWKSKMPIEKYLSYIEHVKRYSSNTIRIYRDVLSDWMEFNGIPSPVSDAEFVQTLTVTSIRNYLVYLLSVKNLSSVTVNLHLSVLSSLCRYLMKNNLISGNPVRLVTRPAKKKRLPVFYKKEDMCNYFEATSHIISPDNLKLLEYEDETYKKKHFDTLLSRLIISVLYQTGIRRSELISMKKGDVNFKRSTIRITGKGEKTREIPINNSLYDEILLYLRTTEIIMGKMKADEENLFTTYGGKNLYPVFIDNVVKSELGKIKGIKGRLSPHVLRHTLATELLDDGADLNSIKELLGHSSMATTQIYTHNSVEKLKKVYNNAHPRAKKGGNHGD